jgi:hypothetical protein
VSHPTLFNCSPLDLSNFTLSSSSTFNTLFLISDVLKTQAKYSNPTLPQELAGYIDFSKPSLPYSGKRSICIHNNIVALHYVGGKSATGGVDDESFPFFFRGKEFPSTFYDKYFQRWCGRNRCYF